MPITDTFQAAQTAFGQQRWQNRLERASAACAMAASALRPLIDLRAADPDQIRARPCPNSPGQNAADETRIGRIKLLPLAQNARRMAVAMRDNEGVVMPDPILVAIAAALAGKAAVAVASGGASALRSMLDVVKRKFSADPEAARALDDARAQPDDDEKIDALGTALDKAARADPGFAQQLHSLWGQAQWGQAQTELIADHGGVVNTVSGSVGGHVVQARDITGGVSLGETARRDAADGSAR
jgi:hypothetical protein